MKIKLMLVREFLEHFLKRTHVIPAIVQRQRHTGKNDPGAGRLECNDHFIQIRARLRHGQAAKTVITAELENNNGGLQCESRLETPNAAAGRVAADTGIDDSIAISFVIQPALQQLGIPGTVRNSITCC